MKSKITYEAEFITFQSDLKSFLYRLVTNQQDTEDLAQETYIKAFRNIGSFKGNSSFKTWVFAIANNLAKDFLKSKARWKEYYQDRCRTATYASREIQQQMGEIAQNSPQGKFIMKEHIDYCFTCFSKTLLLEAQVCLILKEIYAFKNKEIAQITGLTIDKVKHALADSRKILKRIFENKCALISKTGVCHQCSELNGMFNPKQNAQEEAMKIKMVKARDKNNFDQLLDLRFKLVAAIDPLTAEGFDLHNYMLENLPSHGEE